MRPNRWVINVVYVAAVGWLAWLWGWWVFPVGIVVAVAESAVRSRWGGGMRLKQKPAVLIGPTLGVVLGLVLWSGGQPLGAVLVVVWLVWFAVFGVEFHRKPPTPSPC